MGIHSVGTKPIGSTMPCFAAFDGSLRGIDDGDSIRNGVGHIETAAIRIDGQRLRLGAKVTLAGQARIEVTLHGELPGANIDRGNGVAVGQRHVKSAAIR